MSIPDLGAITKKNHQLMLQRKAQLEGMKLKIASDIYTQIVPQLFMRCNATDGEMHLGPALVASKEAAEAFVHFHKLDEGPTNGKA